MAFSRSKAIELARKHIEKKQPRKALQQYEAVRAAGEASASDRIALAELYQELGDPTRGLVLLLEVARDYASAGQHFRAIAVYKQMLRLDPRLYPVHSALAKVYHEAGYINDAISQHQEAIGVLTVRGQPLERLDAIRELLRLDPDNVRARVRLAEDYASEGATEAAVQELRSVTEMLDRRGLSEEYIKVAERILHFVPDDVALSRRLARHHLDMDSAPLALPRLQVVHRAHPGDVDVLEMLAACFEAVGQSPKALTVLKELARTHDRNGLIAERNQVLERVVTLDPGDEWARRAIAGRVIDPAEELGFQELSFDEFADDLLPSPSPVYVAEPSNTEASVPPAIPEDLDGPTEMAPLPDLSLDTNDASVLGRTSLQKGMDELDDLLGELGDFQLEAPSLPPGPPPPPPAAMAAPSAPPASPVVGPTPADVAAEAPPPLPDDALSFVDESVAPPLLPGGEPAVAEADVAPSLAPVPSSQQAVESGALENTVFEGDLEGDREGEIVEFGFEEVYEVDPPPSSGARPKPSRVAMPEETDPDVVVAPGAPSAELSGAAPVAAPAVVVAEALDPNSLVEVGFLDEVELELSPELAAEEAKLAPLADTAAAPAALRAYLDEVDFFLGRGSSQDAAQILAEVPSEYQDHPEVLARIERLTSPSQVS